MASLLSVHFFFIQQIIEDNKSHGKLKSLYIYTCDNIIT